MLNAEAFCVEVNGLQICGILTTKLSAEQETPPIANLLLVVVFAVLSWRVIFNFIQQTMLHSKSK
jgi:hypothetical protein